MIAELGPVRSVLAEIERIAAIPDPGGARKIGFVDRLAMRRYDLKLNAARLASPDDAPDDEWVPPAQTEKILYTREEWCGHLLSTVGWSL